MPLSSMTGYARASASHEGLHWQWEARSVNGKGLDIRCRFPPGFETLEAPAREAVQRYLKRGNVQLAFACDRGGGDEVLAVNEAALEQVVALAERLRERLGGEPLRAEALLGLRGVLDVAGREDDPGKLAARDKMMIASLTAALADLATMRRREGEKLAQIVASHIDRIEALTIAARDNPARSPEAIRQRLTDQLARLLEANSSFDPDRLHQEAVLLATRADIAEEIDRLLAHVEAARRFLAATEPVGRQLDFLAQEFNREANTLCSKSTDRGLTAIGLELKTAIDQMREQVQNIE
ncbi:MAG: YicC/YloC family endoribonuclease [Parvibaculaceae bacterium]